MKKLEKKDFEIKINEILEKLSNELSQGYSENYINFIKFMGNFHEYSLNNLILIFSQYPNASRVAGFKTWEKLGFKILKGSKAIKILAPREVIYIERNKEKIYYKNMTDKEKREIEKHRKEIYFNYANVFDLSQVKGDKEKLNYFKGLGNDNKKLYYDLKKKIENINIKVIETDKTLGAEGISKGGEILIKESMDYNNKFLTLIHEFAHEILDHGEESDRDKTTKKIRELRAETISYIVANYFNIENPFTVDYIKSYGNEKEDIKENLEKILKGSNRIINIMKD